MTYEMHYREILVLWFCISHCFISYCPMAVSWLFGHIYSRTVLLLLLPPLFIPFINCYAIIDIVVMIFMIDAGIYPIFYAVLPLCMMTSSNRNFFSVTGPLCGDFTGHRWIPLTKASDAELWHFLWAASEKNGWVNNRNAGDLRHHRAHYYVTVMELCCYR